MNFSHFSCFFLVHGSQLEGEWDKKESRKNSELLKDNKKVCYVSEIPENRSGIQKSGGTPDSDNQIRDWENTNRNFDWYSFFLIALISVIPFVSATFLL